MAAQRFRFLKPHASLLILCWCITTVKSMALLSDQSEFISAHVGNWPSLKLPKALTGMHQSNVMLRPTTAEPLKVSMYKSTRGTRKMMQLTRLRGLSELAGC